MARNDFQLKIPTDLCVIGFDDIEQASWEGYAITTLRQPIEEMAEAIVKRLTDERDEMEKGYVITFKAFPMWGKTVRA